MRTDLRQVLDRTREIAEAVIAPESEQVDREARWPEAGLRALQRARLGGLVIPEQYGGLGHGLLALVQACEIIGAECTSTALCFGMHCVAAAVIAARTTEEQGCYLEEIAAGNHLTTLALSESGTGSHFYFPQTRLTSLGDAVFCIDGEKHFVTSGGHADSYVVSTAAADPAVAPDKFSCVVVTKDMEGLEWGGRWQGLGLRGNQSRTLKLRNVRVPKSNLIGREGDQIWFVFNVVAPYFLMAMAGTYLGVASTALLCARDHLSGRGYSHNGQSLSQVSMLQHRLGGMWARVERSRRLIYWAAVEADEGGSNALAGLCAAKADIADCAVATVNDALILCGGIGFRDNSKLGRLLRDSQAAHVMSPTTDILLTWTGRTILNEPLLGD